MSLLTPTAPLGLSTERPTLDEFTGLTIDRLESYDYLALNFHAARGLPGTEKSNLDAWLARRADAWTAHSAPTTSWATLS